MRKMLFRAGLMLVAIVAALVILIFCALLFANTNPGRNVVAGLLGPLSGGNVSVSGLGGQLPDAPTAAHVEIRDAHGPWLELDDVSVRWSPFALLSNRILVSQVAAGRVVVLRLPVSNRSEGQNPRVDVGQLEIKRLVLSAAVARHPAALAVSAEVHYTSSTDFSGSLRAVSLDAPGTYQLRGSFVDNNLTGSASLHEPRAGLLATALGLPGLGPVALDAAAAGPTGENRVQLVLMAGALQADAEGSLDLHNRRAALSFKAISPAMEPSPDISWQSIVLNGTIAGAFDSPDVAGHLSIEKLKAGGGSATQITADIQGKKGDIRLTGGVAGLRAPGPHPELFSASPVAFDAHANLAARPRTLDITLSHRLLALSGHILVKDDGGARGAFSLKIAALAPFANLVNAEIAGTGHVNAIVIQEQAQTSIALDGALRIEHGSWSLSQLLEGDLRVAALATLKQSDLVLDDARLENATAAATANGAIRSGMSNLSWTLTLKNISRLVPTLTGALSTKGILSGSGRRYALSATGDGSLATKGFASGPLRLALRMQNLPDAPQGNIDASGKLDGSPFSIAAKFLRSTTGQLRLSLEKGDWKSLRVTANVIAPSLDAPTGRLALHAGRLADLSPIIGKSLAGSIDAAAAFTARPGRARADVNLQAQSVYYDNAGVEALKVSGTVDHPLTKPVVALRYSSTGLNAYGVTGGAGGTLQGPLDALTLTLASSLRAPDGDPIEIAAVAAADIPKSTLTLTRYSMSSKGEEAHLIAPAQFDLAHGVAVNSLRMASGTSDLEVSGRFLPVLDASLQMNHANAQLVKLVFPTVALRGSLSATARLSGTLSAPEGKLAIRGNDLQFDVDAGRAFPPSEISANATLRGSTVTVNADLRTGSKASLTVAGEVPLRRDGALHLHMIGNEDLSLFDPIMNAGGRSVRGELAMDAELTGTFDQPLVFGTGELTRGEYQDVVRGIRISAMTAQINARGQALAITGFSARAGEGTLTGGGSIDLLAPAEPINLNVRAKNAKPISNNVLDAVLNGDLKLAGGIARGFSLSGDLDVQRAEINIPDHLPPQAQVFIIRGRGAAPPPPPPLPLGLNLNVSSRGMIFVRGRGIDAVVSGQVHVRGTTQAPDVAGGFDLKRGNLSFGGQTLDFTSGRVSFDGQSLRNKIDPALNFVAQSSSGGISANLTVTGHASAPKLDLSSTPPLPQDEILARLLFQQSASQLSPWQLAQVGAALASLGDMGGLGDPLTRVRRSLGLDRLAVTSGGSTGTETILEAGRYVAHNIYVGAKQGVAGTSQAVVQVDLTKHLKLQTQVSSNNTPTPVTPGTAPVDTGSNIGLSYQFEY